MLGPAASWRTDPVQNPWLPDGATLRVVGKVIDAVQMTTGNGEIKVPVIEFVKVTADAAYVKRAKRKGHISLLGEWHG